MSDTVHVVLSEGEPVFVSDDLEKCRDAAGKITVGHGKETTIHKNVTCGIHTATDQQSTQSENSTGTGGGAPDAE